MNEMDSKGKFLKELASDSKIASRDAAINNISIKSSKLTDQEVKSAENLHKVTHTDNGSGAFNQNPNLKGFTFEEEHARRFNLDAIEKGSVYRAKVLNPDSVKGQEDIQIYNSKTDEVVQRIQCKCGEDSYINGIDYAEKYPGQTIVVNSEYDNSHDYENGIQKEISFGGVSSGEVSKFDVEETSSSGESVLATNFERVEDAMSDEIFDGIETGAKFGGGYQAIQESIKLIAKKYKNKENLETEDVIVSLKKIALAVSSGALRGAAIKIIRLILENGSNSSMPTVIVSVGMVVWKDVYRFLQNEITFEELLKKTGPLALSRAMIVTFSVLFPPLGIFLLGVSTMKSIFTAFDLKFDTLLKKCIGNDKGEIVLNSIDSVKDSTKKAKDITTEKMKNLKTNIIDSENCKKAFDKTSELKDKIVNSKHYDEAINKVSDMKNSVKSLGSLGFSKFKAKLKKATE